MKKFIVCVITVAGLLIASAVLSQTPDSIQAKAVKVIDSGTIQINYRNRIKMLALIGVSHDKSKRAVNAVSNLIKPGDIITIEFDVKKRDEDNRFLGYVYLPDGRMLNTEILKLGIAKPMITPPNYRHRELLVGAYQEGALNKRGIWKKK